MTANDRDFDHFSWFRSIFRPDELKKLVERSVPLLEAFAKRNPFEAIAFTGMSGAIFAPLISCEMQIPMVMVRKDADLTGCKRQASGFKNFRSYIIVDDLISSGSTVRRIHEVVTRFAHGSPSLVGVATYYPYYGIDRLHENDSPTGTKLPIIELWDKETTAPSVTIL